MDKKKITSGKPKRLYLTLRLTQNTNSDLLHIHAKGNLNKETAIKQLLRVAYEMEGRNVESIHDLVDLIEYENE